VTPASRKERLFWSITLGLGLLAAVGVAELALRVIEPKAVGYHHQPCIYDWDADWGFHYRPGAVGRKHRLFELDNLVRINRRGFHDVERDGPRDDALRVAVVGDSFTASIHVPVEQGWTQLAEQRLARSLGRPVQVWNLGLDGTGTPVHVAVLEKMLPELRPDVVVLAFFANDFDETRQGIVYRECYEGFVITYQVPSQRDALRRLVDERGPTPFERWLFEHVYLSRPFALDRVTQALLQDNYLPPSRFGIPVDEWKGPEPARLFERLRQLAREWRFRLVVVPVSDSLRVLRDGLPAPLFESLDVADPAPAMQAALTREGLEWRDLYWKWDGHFDADGNRVFAEAFADAIAARVRRDQGTGSVGGGSGSSPQISDSSG
jgi:lysophospholipase L1-like esterase